MELVHQITHNPTDDTLTVLLKEQNWNESTDSMDTADLGQLTAPLDKWRAIARDILDPTFGQSAVLLGGGI